MGYVGPIETPIPRGSTKKLNYMLNLNIISNTSLMFDLRMFLDRLNYKN